MTLRKRYGKEKDVWISVSERLKDTKTEVARKEIKYRANQMAKTKNKFEKKRKQSAKLKEELAMAQKLLAGDTEAKKPATKAITNNVSDKIKKSNARITWWGDGKLIAKGNTAKAATDMLLEEVGKKDKGMILYKVKVAPHEGGARVLVKTFMVIGANIKPHPVKGKEGTIMISKSVIDREGWENKFIGVIVKKVLKIRDINKITIT